jgi:hypothetical protein
MGRVRLVLLVLIAASAGSGVLTVTASTSAQTPVTAPASTTPTYLFVQQATGGTMAPADDGTWTLTLTGVVPRTVFFADRPEREAGTVATAELVTVSELFDPDNPPNAAVVLAEPGSEREDVLIVELRQPVYDAAAGTLRYTVTVLGESGAEGLAAWSDRADASLPESFGHVALFIDGMADCLFFPDLCP